MVLLAAVAAVVWLPLLPLFPLLPQAPSSSAAKTMTVQLTNFLITANNIAANNSRGYARTALLTLPTPIRPGPTWAPITGPISEM